MRDFFHKVFSVSRHYLTLWHLKRALVYLIVDILALAIVRRGKSDVVLILKFDHIGDYIIARNFLVRIREHKPYQGKKIILCANAIMKDFIKTYDADAFDEVLWIDRRRMLDNMFYRYEILRHIKQRGAEVAIQCTYGLESFAGDCVMRASGAKVRLGRWLSRGGASGDSAEKDAAIGTTFYRPLIGANEVMFDFDRHRALFSAIFPEVDLPQNTRFKARPVAIPEIATPYIILMPGASDAFREWSPTHFAEAAKVLYDTRGLRSVILGSPADASKAEAIRAAAPGVPIDNLCGQLTLPQVVYMMSLAVGGITNDSGGIHILAALGKPGVAASNGVSFGYFHPYPSGLAPTVSFVYPQAFLDLPLTLDQRKLRFGGGDHLDIADVTPAQVTQRLAELMG